MATIAENIQTLRSIKSDIKNAITDKGGSVGNDFKTYAQAITDLPSGGGGTDIEDALIMRTLSEYSNDRVSVVGDYAFANCFSLKNVNLQNCLSIKYSAFNQCSALLSVNLPLCKRIGGYTFRNCVALTSVNFPNCLSIDNNAFASCSALLSVNLPLCEYIGALVFGKCLALKYVNLQNCSFIGGYAFSNCSNLTQVYLNSVSSVTTIFSNTFSNCPNLTSVYVPASLVDAFKTAQYWSSISTKIVAYTGAQISTEDIL